MTDSTSAWKTGIPYLVLTDERLPRAASSTTSGGTSPGVGDQHADLQRRRRTGIFISTSTRPTARRSPSSRAIRRTAPAAISLRPEVVATFNQTLSPGTGNIVIRDITDTATVITHDDSHRRPAHHALAANNLKIATARPVQWGKNTPSASTRGALLGDGGTPFAGWANDTTWNFNMAAADPLLAAIAALKNHINGTTILTAAQIATHSQHARQREGPLRRQRDQHHRGLRPHHDLRHRGRPALARSAATSTRDR